MDTTHPDVTLAASELRVVLGQLLRRLRAEHRFPVSQLAVLGRLDRDGALTASELALGERVRPQSMAQTLADLRGGGLVEGRPDPGDGRRVLIELTARGRTILQENRRNREGWLALAIATQLTPREQELLLDAMPLLQRLADS